MDLAMHRSFCLQLCKLVRQVSLLKFYITESAIKFLGVKEYNMLAVLICTPLSLLLPSTSKQSIYNVSILLIQTDRNRLESIRYS